MVLTDCNMPGMDGFELVSLLRKKEKLLGRVASPVFGLTAMAEPEVIERGRAAGMTDCLFKPIDLNSLLKNVRYPISPSVVKSEKLLFSLKALSGFSQLAYRDLRDTLIETNRQDMLQLKKASQSGDISQIRHIVHRLMGSAIMVQAETLIRICEQIKKMTNSVGSPPFIQALEWCESEINRLEIELLSTEPDL
jgi:two-component system sensor histidine kinase EvgS